MTTSGLDPVQDGFHEVWLLDVRDVPLDGNPAHSSDSVIRGGLRA